MADEWKQTVVQMVPDSLALRAFADSRARTLGPFRCAERAEAFVSAMSQESARFRSHRERRHVDHSGRWGGGDGGWGRGWGGVAAMFSVTQKTQEPL